MTVPNIFAGRSGSIPLSDLDEDFAYFQTSGGAASIGFIQAGTGAVAQTVQSKLRRVSVDLDDYVTNTVPGTTDCSSGMRDALTYCASLAGEVTLKCLRPPYKIATLSGSTVTFPASSAMMGYCVEIPNNVEIEGANGNVITFIGDWTYRTTAVNTSQKIMFKLSDALGGGTFPFKNVLIANTMIGIYGNGIFSGNWTNISFSGCAFPAILQRAERLLVRGMGFGGGKGAGIVIGGWSTGGTADSGGWAQKCRFEDVTYITFDLLWTATETSIDNFFNTHFYNNAGAPTIPYRGVCGVAIWSVPRLDYFSAACTISNVFSFGSPRPAIYLGADFESMIQGIYCERCGYEDYTYAGTGAHIMGGSGGGAYFQDPWAPGVGAAGKMQGLVVTSTAAPSPNDTTVIGLYMTGCACIEPLSGVANQFAISLATTDVTTPQAWANAAPTLTKTIANANLYCGGTAIQNSGGGAYTTRTIIYSLLGGWVDADYNITLSNKGTAVGDVTIDLPLTAAANSSGSLNVGYYLNLNSGLAITGFVVGGAINLYIVGGVSVVALANTDLTNTTTIRGHIRYRVA